MCQDHAKCFTYLISCTDNLQAGTIPDFTGRQTAGKLSFPAYQAAKLQSESLDLHLPSSCFNTALHLSEIIGFCKILTFSLALNQ